MKQIVSNNSVTESKNHSAATEQKKSDWAAVCSEFNENENVTTRKIQLLQVRHPHKYQYLIVLIFNIAYI